jgi:hypothetical protein
VSVAATQDRPSISVMLFWRRQRRVTAPKRERLREGIEEMRA